MSKFSRKFSQNWKEVKFWVNYLTPKMNITSFLLQIRCPAFTIFSEKAVFSEETAKNCFEVAFDHFLGKGGSSRRQSRLTNMSTRTICCFRLHGIEFSYQNIVATTSSTQTMLPSFLLLINTKFYEEFNNIG